MVQGIVSTNAAKRLQRMPQKRPGNRLKITVNGLKSFLGVGNKVKL